MAFITATLARQEESVHMFWGALVGISLAAGLAWSPGRGRATDIASISGFFSK